MTGHLLGTVAARAALVLGASRPSSSDIRFLRRRSVSADRRRRVLVTDGEQRASLAVVRSLGRAGYDVYVTSVGGKSLAGASRFSRADARVADALNAPRAFAHDVRRLMTTWSIDVLLPVTEASVLALLTEREWFGSALLPTCSLRSFRTICDKAAVLAHATSLSIATPAQVLAADADAARALAADLEYPVVLKPSRSVVEHAGRQAKVGVRHAANRVEFLSALTDYDASAFPLLVQRRIEGPGIGIFILRSQGEIVATFAHRRLRERPPSGGVSVYSESIVADPGLVSLADQLLDRLGWNGVAMVEFKQDRATGIPYLMEINPRFWGSLQLAVSAGVDFPRLLVEGAMGESPTPVTSYRVGARNRWWWGEVDHLLMRMRHSDRELALASDAPSRRQAVLDFLRWRPTDGNETLQLDDARPFFRESANWFRGTSA